MLPGLTSLPSAAGQGQARRAPELAGSGVRRPPVPGPRARARPSPLRRADETLSVKGRRCRPALGERRGRRCGLPGGRVPGVRASPRTDGALWRGPQAPRRWLLLGPARDGRAVLSLRLPTSWIARPAGSLLLGRGANGAWLLGREVGGFSAELGAAGIPESLVHGKVSFQLCHPRCRSGRQSRPEAALCAPLPASVRVPRSRRTERGNRPIEKCAQCQQTPCAQMRLESLSSVSGEAV